MQPLGSVLRDLMPHESRLGVIRQVYETSVGPTLASRSRVLGLRDGRLLIGVRSEASLSDLEAFAGFVARTISERVDGAQVRRVEFRVIDVELEAALRSPAEASRPPLPRPSPEIEAEVENLTAGVRDSAVRHGLREWMAVVLAVREEETKLGCGSDADRRKT